MTATPRTTTHWGARAAPAARPDLYLQGGADHRGEAGGALGSG